MNKSITIENSDNEKMYLCTWNEGETVEIHTEKTLRKEYEGTNLFDEEEGKLINDAMFNWCTVIPTKAYDKARSLDEVFEKFNDEENYSFVGYKWRHDNCTIQRIK
jgi:hypothetical protein